MTVAHRVAVAFRFLTRFPVRVTDESSDARGGAVAYFPVVGLALGVCLAAVAWLLTSRVPAPLLGVVLVALLAGITGGLHLDGLGDVFDGLGGGHGDRARTLAIMRDSRVGAHGAVALILVLVAKVVAITGLVAHQDWRLLVAFPVVARWAVVPLVVWFPYGRPEGLGKSFNAQGSGREVAIATGILVVVGIWAGRRFIGPTLVALAVALALGAWLQRRLGGLTGDVYGAAIELAEVGFVMAAQQEA